MPALAVRAERCKIRFSSGQGGDLQVLVAGRVAKLLERPEFDLSDAFFAHSKFVAQLPARDWSPAFIEPETADDDVAFAIVENMQHLAHSRVARNLLRLSDQDVSAIVGCKVKRAAVKGAEPLALPALLRHPAGERSVQ